MKHTGIAHIELQDVWLAAFCQANHIARLSLFGSVIRADFHDGSDVDILVEYLKDAPIGYMAMMRMQEELSEKIGRQVDLRTPEELSKYFREKVVAEAVVQYVCR